MPSSPLRLIFMGTPEFAVPSLQTLVEHGHRVVAVITAPDKPAGRGRKLTASPVKAYAVSQGIPVLQPEKLKNPDFLEELRAYQADLQIVVAFRMLPEAVWAMPPKGTFNLHASLLPDYRGAAPINWAVINGETETGVTTFFLQHEIDTGDLIFQETEPIRPDDTAGSLYERLMHKGAELVLRTVDAIAAGEAPRIPQRPPQEEKRAPKIFRETCQIDWQQPSQKIVDFVRGLSPYPSAWTELNGRTYKIHRVADAGPQPEPLAAGALLTDAKTHLYVGTADGRVAVEELQPEGKRRMAIEEFFRGNEL
ncbi:methionyl-tRNA formyltransferase [Catalinimonas alkaloidigena]|uniref:Methionyl-tRNA formyltransferase n=1 Tax=Catalinimonas alkaloidigena TaxID=1075417 RepID=A0A1G8XZ66_9BACT|nr:methionyl-tRNA formyltransferase [Catalinimonas alkaloidigena]SDJ95090.1 methionyl-tRNA formyltransferase [Catalinimonas alkaloidigena]